MIARAPRIFIIMGVAGSGKSTVGLALARHLDCPFYDGDDFHPPENVAKMAEGIPLNDADRAPWLDRMAALIQEHLDRGETAVLANSALKRSYRDRLRIGRQVTFIYLEGDFDLIWHRMLERQDHYMKPEMLRSQFETLEPPIEDEAMIVPIDQTVDQILAQIKRMLT